MYEPIKIISSNNKEGEVIKVFSDMEKYRVRITDKIPMPEIILSICDHNGDNKRMAWTRQNISCITAQAKVGKTFLVKLIISACLKTGLFQNRLISEMPANKNKIIYIDTEQSPYHVQLGLHQVQKMVSENSENNIANNQLFDNLFVYQFDAVKTLERYERVRQLIYEIKPDLVIIDGVADLILDSNSLTESDELITNLRIWATEINCHITNIIHLNPNSLEDKMKGHLGTKLKDKSEIVLGVSIDKDNDSNRIVQSLASRNRRPEPFEFSISENGIPEINQYETTQNKLSGKKSAKTEKPDYELFGLLNIIYSKSNNVSYFRYGKLLEQIVLEFEKKFNETLGDSNAKKLLTKFIDNNWILKTGDLKFSEYYLGSFGTEF